MDIAKSDLTQSQREETCHLIKETVKDFAAHYIKPNIRDWDEKQHFAKEVFHKLGDLDSWECSPRNVLEAKDSAIKSILRPLLNCQK